MAISLAKTCFAIATDFSPIVKRNLSPDDVILFNKDGRVEVVPSTQFDIHSSGLPIATPEQHYGTMIDITEEEPTSQKIVKRCKKQKVFTMLQADEYINWDFPMSSVIHAPADSDASISVASGYWIGNSLRVSGSKNLEDIHLYLFKTLGVAYDKSWTTTFSAGYSYTIPQGRYGAIVINPYTTRNTGYMDTGCIGSTTRTEFSFESYKSKEFAQMSWVDGIISLCLGDTYPLPRCRGNGTL